MHVMALEFPKFSVRMVLVKQKSHKQPPKTENRETEEGKELPGVGLVQ
jgi:hypothetical protein